MSRLERTKSEKRASLKKKRTKNMRALSLGNSDCLMQGIQLSQKKLHPGFVADFSAKRRFTQSVGEFQDYAPHIFRDLRASWGVSETQFLRDLQVPLVPISDGAGRSGSSLYKTTSNKFFIKTITYEESKLVRKFLYHYYMHVKRHPHTFLLRLFALFKVQVGGEHYRILVTNNLFNTDLKLRWKFDLKGSKVARDVKDGVGVLKDVNFDNILGKLHVSTIQKEAIMWQVTRDVNFLKGMNIMDMSILLGVHRANKSLRVVRPVTLDMIRGPILQREDGHIISAWELTQKGIASLRDGKRTDSPPIIGREIFFMGIIDILQQYNFKKKIENSIKVFRYRSQREKISAVEAQKYSERFVKYLDSILV